ncbi:glycerol-3-phosphate 1-O-acyltransferase PlsY [Thermoleptolyngbya oregonensis NK1-22]|uniref:Glycerol-3-phosphate acyltransferase n=1 Tax=Thermoleptolyngbya oregonensis NK1-22 TaxID=2547457 RepID=A0AA96Y7F8_9CYAN|nr:glycerol-3-phosphate 1-O-acyltransferase PlsY [Thermoleptolyngbya oregonensis]WOB44134.1 glycerol-3-phosphate 1-O-acyltransferase PlsY [Thermoleptolyngbya oregonensis NK1-22]
MNAWLVLGLVLLAAYVLGSTPTGYWAGKLLKDIDIRQYGSKSTGATNVLRILGRGPAIAVLLIDIFKGVAAIALTRYVYSLPNIAALPLPNGLPLGTWLPWAVMLSGLVAIVAHSKSMWIGFKGGKSAATALGVLFALSWQVGLGVAAAFLLMLALFRIVSLGSIAGAISASLWMIALRQPLPYLLLAIAGGIYVLITHRANIQRLLAGTEPKVGQKHL